MSEPKLVPKVLTREGILKQKELRTEIVDVPEWGGEVLVRELTGSERDEWEGSLLTDEGQVTSHIMRGARARLASLAVIDSDGERVFTDEDVEELGGLSGIALDRVFGVVCKLSGLRQQDIEELEKNSGKLRRGGSGSPSPVSSE